MYRSNFSTCRKCGARIIFQKMRSGKTMPVNPALLNYKAGGKERIVTPAGDVVAGTIVNDPADADGYGYISHFATCEYAEAFRRR